MPWSHGSPDPADSAFWKKGRRQGSSAHAMDTTSYWSASSSLPRFSKIRTDCRADVAIIGAGITGITAAYLLKQAGHTVVLLDRGRCGGFDTANTTAHVTCVTDLRLHELVKRFGKERSKAIWEAGLAAIDRIVENIRREQIECEFGWVPGYLHAALGADKKKEWPNLRRDAQLATELGFSAQFMETIP